MVFILISVVLAALMLLTISLQRTYHHVPAKELKRQAQAGDELAHLLYRAVAYGWSLDIFLWILIGLSGGLFFVFLSKNVPVVVAALGCIVVIWLGFGWLPSSEVSNIGVGLAKMVTPPISWLLERLHPLLQLIARFLGHFRPVTVHTGLFTLEDLLELIERQKVQADNRITKDELAIVAHALAFGNKKVSDVMTPKRMVKAVDAHDIIGPILMGELHDSGHSRFPVHQDGADNIVGTLYVRDMLEAKAGGFVKDVMSKQVYYVHEQQTLGEVLQAFLKTKHHLFIIVNSFEELVGIITIEDVLEQIIGQPIIDEFDQYDDLRAVAAHAAKKEHKNHKPAVTLEQPQDKKESTDTDEMVE